MKRVKAAKQKKNVSCLLEDGKYLPAIMRDFHDSKDLFKAIHQMILVEEHEYAKSVDWQAGMCYVVDVFLYFMAKHGYTLQKARGSFDFADLTADVGECRRHRDEEFAKALFGNFKKEDKP